MQGTLKSLGIFALTIGLFSAVYYRAETTPWQLRVTAALTNSASAALNLLGHPTVVSERPQIGARLPSYVLHDDRIAVDIAIDCNGTWAFAIFVASVLAVRSSWRAKLWGVGLGVPALWLINTVRIVSLYFVAIYVPTIFEEMHLYVWQFLIIAAALFLLKLWADRFLPPANA